MTQSTWRKIQELGFVNRYSENDDCRLFCEMMDGLAFFPLENVQEGMQFLRDDTPEEFENLLVYFDRIMLQVLSVMYDFLDIMKVQNHFKSIFDDFHIPFRHIYGIYPKMMQIERNI